ncbi:HNH nuclease [Sulfitobacter phage phiGT1]|nr:HNH nuclease [Sulfitobacter phage phiGT1]
MLAKFCVGKKPTRKADRRVWLFNAALVAQAIEAKSEPKQVKAKSVRKRTKAADSKFYASWEWKKARYEALRIHGQRCQCCGWRPGDTEFGRLVVDHIKPRSKFPALELDVGNLQIMCGDCNMGKSNVFVDDFRGLDSWVWK